MKWYVTVLVFAVTIGCYCTTEIGSGEEEWLMFNNDKVNNDNVITGDVYNYTQKTIRLYSNLNDQDVYLDASNKEVGQYVVSNEEFTHNFLDFIQYNLERNSQWDDEYQIVLRHKLSLNYFCVTNCGILYMSDVLSMDCIFVKELINEDGDGHEEIKLQRKIENTLYAINMELGQINFKDDATLYSVDIFSINDNNRLTPVIDQANSDVCSVKYENKVVVDQQPQVPELQTANISITVLIISLTVTIVMLVFLIVTIFVFRHVRNVKIKH
nr:fgf-3 [Darna trima granulovirus]